MQRPIQEISRVKLHARLRGPNFHHAAGLRFHHARRQRNGLARLSAQHKIVIVASAQLDLFIVGIDARANRRRLAKIKRRAGHVAKLSRRNQPGIHRRELVRLNHQDVTENIRRAGPRKVKVRMVRQIDHRVFVGRREVLNL